MAIQSCPECGNKISDKASSCPHCGFPILSHQTQNEHAGYGMQCPACASTNIYVSQKGFSGKKALAGAVTIGSLGLLAGTHGKNNILCTCIDCGHKFEPKHSLSKADCDFWEEIDNYLRKGQFGDACVQYAVQKKVRADEASNILEPRLRRLRPDADKVIEHERKKDKIFKYTIVGIVVFIILLAGITARL